jgi:uncharacterized protein YceH (UPF0502 family)
MKYQFTPLEARVIGCLLEKQVTTPEQYPISLNGLTLACNQKTNREPVMELSESQVQQTLDLLVAKHLVRTASGSRTVKYAQRFCNTEFGSLQLPADQVAIIATLLLRGAQTPGELRIRTNRMYEFSDVAQVENTLNELIKRDGDAFCCCLTREPGKRESRYQHLLGSDAPEYHQAVCQTAVLTGEVADSAALAQRVAILEQQLQLLSERLAVLENHE